MGQFVGFAAESQLSADGAHQIEIEPLDFNTALMLDGRCRLYGLLFGIFIFGLGLLIVVLCGLEVGCRVFAFEFFARVLPVLAPALKASIPDFYFPKMALPLQRPFDPLQNAFRALFRVRQRHSFNKLRFFLRNKARLASVGAKAFQLALIVFVWNFHLLVYYFLQVVPYGWALG